MGHIWSLLTTVVTVASLLLVGLHWLRGALEIWIAPQSPFWNFYDKTIKTIEYISFSRKALGKGGTLAMALGGQPVDEVTEKRKMEAGRL